MQHVLGVCAAAMNECTAQQRDVRKTLLRGCRVAMHHGCETHLVVSQTRASWLMAWYKAGTGPSGQVRCTAERQTTTDFWGTCVAQACKASGGATGLGTALAQVQPQC